MSKFPETLPLDLAGGEACSASQTSMCKLTYLGRKQIFRAKFIHLSSLPPAKIFPVFLIYLLMEEVSLNLETPDCKHVNLFVNMKQLKRHNCQVLSFSHLWRSRYWTKNYAVVHLVNVNFVKLEVCHLYISSKTYLYKLSINKLHDIHFIHDVQKFSKSYLKVTKKFFFSKIALDV